MLGQRIRPGDLPSDAEVREQVIALQRESDGEAGRLRADAGARAR